MVAVIAALLSSPFCCGCQWPLSSSFAACVMAEFAHRVELHANEALWGFEVVLARRVGVTQATAEREMSYMGPQRSRTRRYRRAGAAREGGEVGNGNGVGWSYVVGIGRARFGMARKFV
ncbi:hypothetical protein EDB83DRAFT_2315033 [Lactarius deliciosus]|nr:hypothetical protein EDB83DRAFT_2327901 [Lactarius deliciosus]KAH9066015.1 hypothetical protein EDB83DRAFT_2315033 [Lactarius deliciosus]